MTKLLFAIILFFSLLSIQSCEQNAPTKQNSIAMAMADYETYLEMRENILKLNPSEFRDKEPENSDQVFGNIMDWNIGDTIITVFALETGDVSVYYSTGLFYMNGIQVEKFKKLSHQLIRESNKLIDESDIASPINMKLPKSGMVNFFFITKNAISYFTNSSIFLTEKKSKRKDLFSIGVQIIETFDSAVNKK